MGAAHYVYVAYRAKSRVYFFSYHNSHNVVIDAVPFIIVVSVSQCQAKEFDESVRN